MNFVADQAGLTKQELSDMLNGRKIIKACDIPRMAKALGVGSDDVYAAGAALLP
ncbi:MAG: helix-turn-helix domain-containing protein [Lachnospiraceae bacterium]|nr:helix-turn-helix domain-containing protein [Lachnospiraceae bacterium]